MNGTTALGWQGDSVPARGAGEWARAVHDVGRPVYVVRTPDGPAVAGDGTVSADPRFPLLAAAGPVDPAGLGSATFREDYGLRAAYMAGAMAGGIASAELVIALARAGYLASYGAAGQLPDQIERSVEQIQEAVGGATFAVNLIHSPSEAALEEHLVEVLLRRQVHLVEASAFLELTAPLVRYRLSGAREDGWGGVHVPNRIIAKVSRPEIAELFLGPPPPRLVAELLDRGAITAAEADLAPRMRMADDLTAEADSGGHTDRRPLHPLLSVLTGIRDRVAGPGGRPRVGAAGGLGTPGAIAAAYAAGADYVVTGSVNQSCRESGTSDRARDLLVTAGLTDFAMAPAADMFELGVELQVLRKGTMFPMRAGRLGAIYQGNEGLEDLSAKDREWLEKSVLRASVEEVWSRCEEYFTRRDPEQLARAQGSPKRRMALVFRWYLGLSSRWAVTGQEDRVADYQIWSGPALGAFNDWVAGTPLAQASQRSAPVVADLLMRGAAVATRQAALRAQGAAPVPVDAGALLAGRPDPVGAAR